MLRRLKLTLIGFGALAFIGITVYLVDIKLRCHDNGLMQEAAEKIANRRLGVAFNKKKAHEAFTLQNVQWQEEDHSWMFTYKSGECEVVIVIDNCGVADVGGVSEACIL